MQVVDFTNLPRRNKLYAGANGSKISVIYEGQQYMLKFPPLPSKNKEMSYSNSCFSEYLGCQIYFADFFDYWVTNRQSTVKMTWLQASAPQTYTYFEALEADGWS